MASDSYDSQNIIFAELETHKLWSSTSLAKTILAYFEPVTWYFALRAPHSMQFIHPSGGQYKRKERNMEKIKYFEHYTTET